MEARIRKEVTPKLKKGTDLTATQEKVKDRFLNVTRPLPGVIEGSVSAIRTQFDLGESFNSLAFSGKFEPGSKHVDRWKSVVHSECDRTWTRTVDAITAEIEAKRAREEEAKLRQKGKERAKDNATEDIGKDKDADQEGEQDAGENTVKDASEDGGAAADRFADDDDDNDDNPKEEIITCPANLKLILRQEFQAQEQEII
ncbi:hypothetical protein BGZ68_003990, partial [Mortierella alpina]